MSTNDHKDKLVMVTGGTGFVGVHCILQLLNQGYQVRTTLRSFKRKAEVIEMLRNGGVKSIENLSFMEADLTRDDNWDLAVKNCDYVLHVASPISLTIPKHEDEVIRPAVDGTIRVLKAASRAGVKRVVLTSSFAAIGYGPKPAVKPYTEENWTDPNDKSLAGSAYIKSKALAEKAAWDFMEQEGADMELTVINPVGIFGPLLGADMSTAFEILQGLMEGTMKATPHVNFGIVDVRDVADLHLRAMVNPEAKGQRFLAIAGEVMSLHDIAILLKDNMGDHGKKVTTKILPNWVVRVAAFFSAKAKRIVPQLGKVKHASNEKAKNVLSWKPRTNEEAIIAAAESMVKFRLIKSA